MSDHMQLYTLFEIVNASDLVFAYRQLRTEPPLPSDGLRPVRAQQMADQLWKQTLKCPVFPRFEGKATFFLVPTGVDIASPLTVPGVPDRIYNLQVTSDTYTVRLSEGSDSERLLAARSLERALTDRLRAQKDRMWRDTWTRFFLQQAENEGHQRDRALAFRGVTFAVVPISGRLYLAMDVVTRYTSRHSLAWYIAQGKMSELERHNYDVPIARRAPLVRDNGNSRYTCFFQGLANENVSEYVIGTLQQTVVEYYRQNHPRVVIPPDDPVVLVVDGRNNERTVLPVPASRLFPSFGTEDEAVRRCSVAPTLSPESRLDLIRNFRQWFLGSRYGDVEVQLAAEPLEEPVRFFPVPPLEFGGGYRLRPPVGEKPGQVLARWNSNKIRSLYQHKPFFSDPLPPIFLLFPESMTRENRELLLSKMGEELTSLGFKVPGIRQIPYTVDANGRDLQAQTAKIVDSGQYAFLVCVLAEAFKPQVHGEFKMAAQGLGSQCVQEANAAAVAHSKPRLRNFILGVLVAAGVKPWVLGVPLNADVTVGIDVLPRDGRVIFNYLYGFGGREVYQAMRRTHREMVKRRPLRQELFETLSAITESTEVRRLVIHRDGRLWPDEAAAIDQAIDELITEGKLAPEFQYCVAEIRKSHAPIRIMHRNDGELQNPFPGCYLLMDSRRGLVNTTGKPLEWSDQNRTASTLLVDLAHNPGGFKITDVMRDVFYLSQLNWNAPEYDIGLPVTIRWADDALREELVTDLDD